MPDVMSATDATMTKFYLRIWRPVAAMNRFRRKCNKTSIVIPTNVTKTFILLRSQTSLIMRFCLIEYVHNARLNEPREFAIPGLISQGKAIKFGTNVQLNMIFDISSGFNEDCKNTFSSKIFVRFPRRLCSQPQSWWKILMPRFW